ncbi:hypothetical protein ABIE45_002644 [Methylobacterium sp. OAE515]|uniref:hypothetical protein n=1 Tax=Methylobacterium sp. OAE515 TaxID=2817895 RepID=UPI001789DDC8
MTERHLSVGSPDDAELIALGKQFEPLHAAYWDAVDQMEAMHSKTGLYPDEPDTDQMLDELLPLLRAISALQAHTEAGKRVKLLAWAHCENGAFEGVETRLESTSPNEALIASMFLDLCREQGIMLRVRPLAERTVLRRGSLAKGSASKMAPASH